MKTEKLRPKKVVIRWTDAEWDKLTDLVFAMRQNSPDSIATLANRAQKQFPKSRQRPGILTTAALKPLIDRIQRREREVRQKAERCDELATKLTIYQKTPVTREEILQNLDDEELRSRFLLRMFRIATPFDVVSAFDIEALFGAVETADLAGIAIKRLVKDIAIRPVNVVVNMPESPAKTASRSGRGGKSSRLDNRKKKRIVVIGTKGDQPRRLQEKVGDLVDLICIGVEQLRKDSVPKKADHVILWSKFLSHEHRQMVFSTVESEKISEHFAGLTELTGFIERVDGALTKA